MEWLNFIKEGAVFITSSGVVFGAVYRIFILPHFNRVINVMLREALNSVKESDLDDEGWLGKRLKNDRFEADRRELSEGLRDVKEELKKTVELARENREFYGKVAMTAKKTELMMLINTQPDKVDVINMVYDEYVKAGGNSYISEFMSVWREEFEKPELRRRIKDKKRGRE